VALVLGLLFLALAINLNVVQVVKGGSFRNDARNQRVLLNEYSSPRGQIVAQGTAIAESKATKDELKYLRVYPRGPIYAPVTGYYSFTHGATGIEEAENDILSGDSPQLFTSRISDILTGRNPRGGSVDLTLNRAAQAAAYNAMRTSSGTFKRGAVVALDPQTGAILALVSTPSFDPNRVSTHKSAANARAYRAYINDRNQPMLDRALQQNYPSGSIFKIIDAAAALRLGVKPDDRIPAANSFWPLQPKRTSPCPANLAAPCIENYGGETCDNGKTATMAFAFAKSCNTAFAALAVDRIGPDELADQANKFGFDLPYQGIRPPNFCDPPAFTVPLLVCRSSPGSQNDMNDPAALAQTAIGQRDVRITPIQAAMLSAAVANNGTLYKPYLVQRELRPNLTVLSDTQPQQLSQVLDADLDQDLIKMMEGVVSNPEGTGGPANITDLGPSVVVGGKTGTADVCVTSASRCQPDAWFTGFALVNGTPKIAVAVIQENAGTAGNEVSGGEAAGPVAARVMEAYLRSIGTQ
jgi:peptidoglycan glycosyltransferase